MRPTTRTVLVALVVAAMLVVAGCSSPSAPNNTTEGEIDGTITTIAPEDTPSNDSDGAAAAGEETEASGYSLVSLDATG